MPRKLRELRDDLRRAGFVVDRQRGSHQMWKHPQQPGISAVLAGQDSADAQPYQERQVRQALQTLRAGREREQQ
jgi:predicted RNA binding protein YcfA (HicA-like mRNA interferase family)